MTPEEYLQRLSRLSNSGSADELVDYMLAHEAEVNLDEFTGDQHQRMDVIIKWPLRLGDPEKAERYWTERYARHFARRRLPDGTIPTPPERKRRWWQRK